MNTLSKNKYIDFVMLVIGWLPTFWAIGIVLFAIRARIHLGYWPTPNHPDPQVLPFDLHDSILYFSGYAVFWSLLVLPVFKIFLFRYTNLILWRRTRFVLVSGWALVLILMIVPNINFVAWYLD